MAWVQIGGPAQAVFAGAFGLFATNLYSADIFRYSGRPNEWTKVGGPGAAFAVGSRLWGLTPNRQAVMQFDGTGWVQIGGPAQTLYGGICGLYATSPDTGDIWKYNGRANDWRKVGGPGATFAVGNRLWGLTPNKQAVMEWNGHEWTQIGGPANNLYGGAFGLLATNPSTGDIWKYNGRPNDWTKAGGPGADFAGAHTIFGLTPDRSAIWRREYNPSTRTYDWRRVGDPAAAIAVWSSPLAGIDQETVVALNPDSRVVWAEQYEVHFPG